MTKLTFAIQVKTTNPLNGQTGNSKWAAIRRTKDRRSQRAAARLMMLSRPPSALGLRAPFVITLTRVAPSGGLDDDGLRAAMKSVRDGIADGLGFTDDRDPMLEWRYAQVRGPQRIYRVVVEIEEGE